MAKLRAALLAAGRGVRMRTAAPKTLTRVSDDNPLLHYILSGLERAGVEDLLVVTGSRPGSLHDYVTEHWKGEAAFVFNARYASWNNFHSARLAMDQSPEHDLLVVNSDVIVHPEVYRRAVGAPGDLVLAVQSRADLSTEDMRVRLEADRVLGLGKTLPMSESHGEFTGVSLVRPAAARAYARLATDLEWRARTSVYYEDLYAQLLDLLDARAVEVGPDEYAEIDSPEDVEGAAAIVAAHPGMWDDAPEPDNAGAEPHAEAAT